MTKKRVQKTFIQNIFFNIYIIIDINSSKGTKKCNEYTGTDSTICSKYHAMNENKKCVLNNINLVKLILVILI